MSPLYLPQQDETEIFIDDKGNLLITQFDNLPETEENTITIKPIYIDSFLELIQAVIKDR